MSKKIKFAAALAGWILAAILMVQSFLAENPIPKYSDADSTSVSAPAEPGK